MLVLFVTTAWFAVRDRCATYDEPNDSIQAWTMTRLDDYRISPWDPPLPYYWAGLIQTRDSLHADFNSPEWRQAAHDVGDELTFSANTLYRTPGNDADAFLNRSRVMMLALGALTAIIMAAWGWRIGGGACAAAAMVLFCLDPNLIAHSPLVKNDVAMALAAVALFAAVWAVGRRASALRIIALGLMCGATLCTKFTGPVFGPMVAVALICRALLPEAWVVLGRPIASRGRKLVATVGIGVVCLLLSYGFIWGCYRFRFNPSPDPSFHLESHYVVHRHVELQLMLKDTSHTHMPTPQEVDATTPDLVPRLALFLEDHHILPEPFTNGIVRNYETGTRRSSFLIGQYGAYGWWYYFPLAFIFKTPLATLAAITLACAVSFRWRRPTHGAWTAICIAVPIALYSLSLMAGSINLGIRHLFPIYPFVFIGVGLAFVPYVKTNQKRAMGIALALGVGLAVETLTAFGDFIPFFNVACGGERGGLALLSDSNLDWGQDLKLLADWQKKHPDTPMYLWYFGTADPHYYGLHYINMPGSTAPPDPSGKPPRTIAEMSPRGVIAISATMLQWTYYQQRPEPQLQYWGHACRTLREHKSEAITVLGGSIYIYSLDRDSPTE
jgi:hypothetical protein